MKLVARPETSSSDDEHSSNEDHAPVTTDQQSIDNNARKLVQFVFILNHSSFENVYFE